MGLALLLFKIGFLKISITDLIDILLVSLLLFQIYKQVKGSIAIKIFVGLLSIYFFYLVVKAAEMELLTSILNQFVSVGVIGTIVLFQQELRRFIIVIGRKTMFSKSAFKTAFFNNESQNQVQIEYTVFVEAAKHLGATHTGALIVFAKENDLKFFEETGDQIDAISSKRLITSIFNKTSPLHDGAMIIVNNRITAVRCILPVSDNENLPAFLGLRHRAALGISEATDAVVLVVSEETGEVSLVKGGRIYHNLTQQDLLKRLPLFIENDDDQIAKELMEMTNKELVFDN